MNRIRFVAAAAFAFACAGPALADCTVSSDPQASVRPLDPAVASDADLLISASMTIGMTHADYAQAVRQKSGCELGSFVAGGKDYVLYGNDAKARTRIARTKAKRDAIAEILPVVDIMKTIAQPGQTKNAVSAGYMLATMTPGTVTVWRFYTGMPSPAMLMTDMASALSGNGSPVLRRTKDGKTQIFVPPASGSGATR